MIMARTLAVPGVRDASSLQSRRFEIHGNTVRGSLIGLDYPADRGDWIPLQAGRSLAAGRGEAIADESTGLRLGDVLDLDGTLSRWWAWRATTWTPAATRWWPWASTTRWMCRPTGLQTRWPSPARPGGRC
jgi:hypothetical protein